MKISKLKNKFINNLKDKWYRQNVIIIFICFILIFSMSIGYSVLLNNLKVDSEIVVEGNTEMKIYSIENNNSSCGYELYNAKSTSNTISLGVALPAVECSASYIVTIDNPSDKAMSITNISATQFSNAQMVFEFGNLAIGDVVLPSEKISDVLTITYRSDISYLPDYFMYEAIIEFEWEEYDPANSTKISYNTTKWTNENVVATLTLSDTSSVLNNGGSNQYIFNDNGTFVFQVLNLDGSINEIEARVDWIDKIPPNTFIPIINEINENSIKVLGETEDSGSGISGYRYSTNDGHTWLGHTNDGYTFSNLAADTAYSIKILAIDKAGNETESYSVFVRTEAGANSINLPITITPNAQGQYFVFGGFPNGITYVGDHWEGNTFTFVLAKPQSPPNNGQNALSFTLPIENGTSYQWTSGQINASIGSGIFNKATPSLGATTVNSGQKVNVTLDIQAKIDVNIVDKVSITTSYLVNGTRRYIYINFYWIPYNGYMLYYEGNGGIGEMPLKICTSNIACNIDANTFTKEGNKFLGWSTSASGPVLYNNNASIPANTYATASKIGLYAKWGS